MRLMLEVVWSEEEQKFWISKKLEYIRKPHAQTFPKGKDEKKINELVSKISSP